MTVAFHWVGASALKFGGNVENLELQLYMVVHLCVCLYGCVIDMSEGYINVCDLFIFYHFIFILTGETSTIPERC